MILFPAMMVGGQLLITVVDRVPNLNFEPVCRESAGENLGGPDDFRVCMGDESAARETLAKQWSAFDSADRARCLRLSTTGRSASYVEVLTCLEMNRDARKLHPGEDSTADLGERVPPPAREETSLPAESVHVARQPVAAPPPPPLPLAPRPGSAADFLQLFCLPGLKSVLPGCPPSGGRP